MVYFGIHRYTLVCFGTRLVTLSIHRYTLVCFGTRQYASVSIGMPNLGDKRDGMIWLFYYIEFSKNSVLN